MWIHNKYLIWYLDIIGNAAARLNDVEGEKHHIIPIALGGRHGPVVKLTFREHFLCHWLLTKCTGGSGRIKMLYALGEMRRAGPNKRIVSSWQFDVSKRASMIAAPLAHVGRKHSPETRQKISMAKKGKSLSIEHKTALRLAKLGKPLLWRKEKPLTMRQAEQLKRAQAARRGSKNTAEHNAAISRFRKGLARLQAA